MFVPRQGHKLCISHNIYDTVTVAGRRTFCQFDWLPQKFIKYAIYKSECFACQSAKFASSWTTGWHMQQVHHFSCAFVGHGVVHFTGVFIGMASWRIYWDWLSVAAIAGILSLSLLTVYFWPFCNRRWERVEQTWCFNQLWGHHFQMLAQDQSCNSIASVVGDRFHLSSDSFNSSMPNKKCGWRWLTEMPFLFQDCLADNTTLSVPECEKILTICKPNPARYSGMVERFLLVLVENTVDSG